MIRVLQIIEALNVNGTETFIMNVFRNLDKSAIMFDFLVCRRVNSIYEEEAERLGAKLYEITPRKQGLKAHIDSLHSFFKEHASEYQAVHLHGNSFTSVMPVAIAAKYNIPLRIVHSHNTSTRGLHNKLLHFFNKRRLHKIATHYLACSAGAKEWGYKGTKVLESSVVIPNGINLNFFYFSESARNEIREQLQITKDTLVVTNTAAFREVKNHPFLIEIFEEIKKQHPNSILLLCGNGVTQPTIKELVRDKKLEDSVRFLGVRPDINKILSASDVYIFPSFYEGLPFALIEAQASGIPVLASDKISKEILLSDGIHLKTLQDSASDWADTALKMTLSNRIKTPDKRLLHYDIITTCSIMSKIYTER